MTKMTTLPLRRALGLTVGATALLCAGGAWAQQAAQEENAGPGTVVEDVIVTAQKREENLQDVPVSISVVGDDQLENYHVTQLSDLNGYIPGFQASSGGSPGQTTLSLRGVAPVGPGQTVGVYLDDTPVGSSSFYARGVSFTLDLLPYDIERYEILRGPQGTLYGASSIGGLFKYVTVAPNLNDFEARAGADVFGMESADDLGYGVRASINAPLAAGEAAIRASYSYQQTPGFVDNVVTGAEDQNEFWQQGGRLSFLWRPTENVSLALTGLWQSVQSDNNTTVASSLTRVPFGDGRSNNNFIDEPFDKDFSYYAATLRWDLGWAEFISATSYSDTSTHQVVDASYVYGSLFPLFGPFPVGLSEFTLDLGLTKWTQEFRLASNGGDGERFSWLIGAFYTDEDSSNEQSATAETLDRELIPGLHPLVIVALPSTYREYAFFGEATYRFTDQFRVSAGLRYAHNDQDFRQISSGVLLPTADNPGSSSEGVWTYSISPQFHVDENTMIYARVASGYRPGGPNVVVLGADAPSQVDSDSLTNYEAGIKTRFLGGRAVIDAAAFFMDWQDIQISVFSGGVSFLANAGAAESKGVEFSAALIPIEGLRLGANAAYTEATLTELSPEALINGAEGDRLPQIPRWQLAFTADYTFPLRSGWDAHIGGGWRYLGDRLSDLESSPFAVTARSYDAFDLNADVSNDRWTLRLFIKNVGDERGEINAALSTDGLNTPLFVTATPVQPRTIGLALDARF